MLAGNRTCDPSREFAKHCGGLYVAAVAHGPHTKNEFWAYMEAPINPNDEGPLSLFRGAFFRVALYAPSAVVFFFVYDAVKRSLGVPI